MEYSSPLAAMRPQPCPSWGSSKDLPLPRLMFGGYPTYDPSSFDFKNMSMQQNYHRQGRRDYFSLRPARGSSPTSSLTADLDANFHIDNSPQVQTPRRSLFTTNLFHSAKDAAQITTPPVEGIEEACTPVVPSSSPGVDAMELSPLPHKPAYFAAQIRLSSPSPDSTPHEDIPTPVELLAPPDFATSYARQAPSQPFLTVPEPKRPATRPALTRHKGYSTNQIPTRPLSAENQLPPFRFGNVATTGLSCSSTPSLAEGFAESPIAMEVQPPSYVSMLPPPRRPSIGAANRALGSPCGGHVRKPSGSRPSVRPPRKQIRRSLSMFQHPEDVMRGEQDTYEQHNTLTSIMDVDQQEHVPKLPHFIPDEEPDSLPRISQDTMADILDSKYNSEYDEIVVVDCRFEYEYNGGHIQNAVNFNDKQLLANKLFEREVTGRKLLIFHCEYSVHRAPLTAKFIRNHDRNVNAEHYPRLTYPELYVLDGGYSQFFKQHRSKCFPQNYVEMSDERHEQACERGMAKVKQRQKLFRASTFAFGQNDHDDMNDSPTAQGRHALGPRSHSTLDVSPDITFGIGQSFQRRMASY
ncbi:putative cdc25-like protein tyrosine phosphatase [Polychaeton citri CBS 116435]|uniref:M-phase inducer phosphatase n=1 Tax=Polychaeton citri CBS 116435 TaxID=1314669 RepID=A0A9P4UNH4_9PEZI|nr:putative cdc25-like protein tyrosine phosphatase [Polychaeton citri CBS 116435]